jgi:transcription termination/antitermination protein NusG
MVYIDRCEKKGGALPGRRDAQGSGAVMPRWYAVQTRSNFEKIVHSELCGKEIESYLPVLPEMRQWKDRVKRIEQPVFSGYVFARFVDDPGAKLRVLRSYGAVRILGNASAIEAIPDPEIEGVRRLLMSSERSFVHPFLREGMRVRVKRGPLRDVEGLLVRFRNQARLVLSIDLLSRSVAAEINAGDVEALGRSVTAQPWQ